MSDRVKEEALKHYDEMIAWAEKQPKKEKPHRLMMRAVIKQEWHGRYCSYCNNDILDFCSCRLHAFGGCCGGLWCEMNDSSTWEEWVINAKKVRAYIVEYG